MKGKDAYSGRGYGSSKPQRQWMGSLLSSRAVLLWRTEARKHGLVLTSHRGALSVMMKGYIIPRTMRSQ
jgi:hypothetical protein